VLLPNGLPQIMKKATTASSLSLVGLLSVWMSCTTAVVEPGTVPTPSNVYALQSSRLQEAIVKLGTKGWF
jgi:hypothetical protein